MIINIRGTSGCGKTTLIKKLMESYEVCSPFSRVDLLPKRKRPVGYLCERYNGRMLCVLGHYEAPCGGCDTISSMDHIFELVRTAHGDGCDVIIEGLILSTEAKRTTQLHEDGLPLVVLAMNVDIEECLRSINERRRRKNPDKDDVNPKNTIAKVKCVQNLMKRFEGMGIDARWVTREEALPTLCELLEI